VSGERVERRLAAVLAGAVEDYSRLIHGDEEAVLTRLKTIRKAIVAPSIASHRGRIVKTVGDSMLVEFASSVDAARSAVEVQRAMAAQNSGKLPETRIEFRIGLHVGDIIVDENDIFGDCVNIAARLQGLAEPGGLSLSDDAYRQIRGKIELICNDLGPQRLKNIAEPVRVWRVAFGDGKRFERRGAAIIPPPRARTSRPLSNFPRNLRSPCCRSKI
jgi:adenylate cyclase